MINLNKQEVSDSKLNQSISSRIDFITMKELQKKIEVYFLENKNGEINFWFGNSSFHECEYKVNARIKYAVFTIDDETTSIELLDSSGKQILVIDQDMCVEALINNKLKIQKNFLIHEKSITSTGSPLKKDGQNQAKTAWAANYKFRFILVQPRLSNLQEICYYLTLLKTRSVKDEDILVHISFSAFNPTLRRYADFLFGFFKNIKVTEITDIRRFIDEIETTEIENSIVTVLGHSSEGHLRITNDSSGLYKIGPRDLLNSLFKSTTKNIGILFGCCYSGIFRGIENIIQPPKATNRCLIGQSNLSRSYPFPAKTETIMTSHECIYTSHEFEIHMQPILFYFFHWLCEPTPIDGDKTYSLSDAYKYSVIKAEAWHTNSFKTLSPLLVAVPTPNKRSLIPINDPWIESMNIASKIIIFEEKFSTIAEQ